MSLLRAFVRTGRKLRNAFRSETGAAAVEFAVAAPILILLAIGAGDFARVHSAAIAVANGARAAAEFGSYSVDNSGNTALINQAGLDDAADAGSITVTSTRFCKCPDGSNPDCTTGTCPAPYSDVEVFVKANASKTVQLVFSYPGIPRNLTVRDSATFRAQ